MTVVTNTLERTFPRDTLPLEKGLIDYMTDKERWLKRAETEEKIEDAQECLQFIEKRIGEHIEEFKRTAMYLENKLRTEDRAATFGGTISSGFDYPTKGRIEELVTDLGTKKSELSNLERDLKRYIRR